MFQRVDNSVREHGKFDQAGVIHHISTEGGASPWVNAHEAGRVRVEWSSRSGGSEKDFVSKHDAKVGGASFTKDQPNSWMRVDLGAHRTLAVTHYALRQSTNNAVSILRNWELQGAHAADGPWTTLRRHDNDTSIEKRGGFVAAWVVDWAPPFRFLRIHQHGENAKGSGTAHCAGIELYGELVEDL
eukprot:COSAG03_NODE_2664_length_2544_cov_1.326380_1_plen_186_part_00